MHFFEAKLIDRVDGSADRHDDEREKPPALPEVRENFEFDRCRGIGSGGVGSHQERKISRRQSKIDDVALQSPRVPSNLY